MAARIRLRLTKQHGWYRVRGVHLHYENGRSLTGASVRLTGEPMSLWANAWEKAAFGHGRFGYGSFGWAQGGMTSGGFGYGLFGDGEFGYYNEVFEWISPDLYEDGWHTFGLELVGTNNQPSASVAEQTVFVVSQPSRPRLLEFESMAGGVASVRLIGGGSLGA